MAGRLIGGSLSYDRVADIYDATRAWPEHVACKLTDALVAELAAAGADRVLEVGIGTGRIVRPLMERGVRVCGVDIAPRMLAKLREQLGPTHLSPDLVLGDATHLPVAPGSFRAILLIHVLHLVSSFERAVAEARRVLARGGVLFRHITRYQGDSPWQPGHQKWDEMLAARHFARHPTPSPEQVSDALRAVGGACRRVVYAEIEERTTPAENLDRIRRRIDSWSWEIPDDLFAECLAEYEGWLARRYPDLNQEFVVQVQYELEVWSFQQNLEPRTWNQGSPVVRRF